MQRQLCVARSARSRPLRSGCRGATGPIIIICKQARAGAGGGGVRGVVTWPAAIGCGRWQLRRRAPVLRRQSTRMYARCTLSRPRHAHHWRDRDLHPFLFIFRARPSGRFVFRRQRDEEKKEARMDQATGEGTAGSYTKVLCGLSSCGSVVL